MREMTLPNLVRNDHHHIPVGLPTLTTRQDAPAGGEGAAAVMTPNSLTHLMEALDQIDQVFQEARQMARQAHDHHVDFQLRAVQAEADRANLEQELSRLRSHIDKVEQKVPRWVRRFFKAD